MSNISRLTLLNQALSFCSLGHIPFDELGSRQTFGFGPDALNIVGNENRQNFDQTVSKLIETGVAETLSKQKFMGLLVPKLQAKKKVGCDFTKQECEDFWRNVEAIPIVEHRVMREVFGASLSNSPNPLSFACFTIYDWARHNSLISRPSGTNDSWVWQNSAHGLLVECKVLARDQQKALELADVLFSRLESVIRFMIGHRTERYDVGILNYAGSRLSQHYVFSDEHISTGSSRMGPIELVPLDEDYFARPSPVGAVSRLTR